MRKFVTAAKVGDIPEGAAVPVVVKGRRIAICNLTGVFYAIDDTCTHEEASLSDGELQGDEIECPRHAARFNVKTGAVCSPPAFEDLQTYPTRIVGEVVEVEIDEWD